MVSWWKLKDGAYSNPQYIVAVYSGLDPADSVWRIGFVGMPGADATVWLDGDYADKAEADAAAKDLVNGVTVQDLI